jgi:hypothetical protein
LLVVVVVELELFTTQVEVVLVVIALTKLGKHQVQHLLRKHHSQLQLVHSL